MTRHKRKGRSSGSDSTQSYKKKNSNQRGPTGGSEGTSENSNEVSLLSNILNEANSVLFQCDSQEPDNVFSPSVPSAHVPHSELIDMSVQREIASDCAPIEMVTGGASGEDIVKVVKRIESRFDSMDIRLKSLEEMREKVDSVEKDVRKLWISVDERDKKVNEKLQRVEERVDATGFETG